MEIRDKIWNDVNKYKIKSYGIDNDVFLESERNIW